jgi:hypothetical protein
MGEQVMTASPAHPGSETTDFTDYTDSLGALDRVRKQGSDGVEPAFLRNSGRQLGIERFRVHQGQILRCQRKSVSSLKSVVYLFLPPLLLRGQSPAEKLGDKPFRRVLGCAH